MEEWVPGRRLALPALCFASGFGSWSGSGAGSGSGWTVVLAGHLAVQNC